MRTRAVLAALREGNLSREEGLALLRRARESGAEPVEVRKPDPAPTASEPADKGAAGTALMEDTGVAEAVGALLTECIARHTGTPEQRIVSDAPFERYGFDSVMAIGVVNDLEPVFGPQPPTLLFEVRTLAELAAHLITRHPEAASRLSRTTATSQVTVPAQITAEPLPATPRPASVERPTTPRADDRGDREIAVVGISGRFPQADDVDTFWANLRDARDCIEEVPADRWDHSRVFDPEPGRAGRSYSRWGGFLSDVDRFDHAFFRISPRQAAFMDPQERLLLQEVWHALEDAGTSAGSLAGRRVGVYVGVMYSQYQLWGMGGSPYEGDYLGSSYASIANRVSHYFDLRGPSIALDTMCSSSLTGLHLATEALRAGSIDAAVVAGVNLTLHPRKHVDLSQGRFASTDGRCRAFGTGGDGYVPGEAVVATLLKRREDAERDGDRIWATVLGSAVSHGGRTNGYTTPNPDDQARVMREAMADAGVEPADISYIEAHGTGTILGDSIETRSLGAVLAGSEKRPRTMPCPVGAVKSNVGHCEASAGIVGLVKTVLQLRHGELVPSLHSERLNPDLDVPDDVLRIQQENEVWPRTGDRSRLAGVSSFGAGGASAHVVVAEAPAEPVRDDPQDREYALPLSAGSEDSLRATAAGLRRHLREHRSRLDDVEFTLVRGREHLEYRCAVVASSVEEAVERLGRVEAAGAVDTGGHGGAQETWVRSWCAGGPGVEAPNWDLAGRPVRLPGYVFARHRHWPEAADAAVGGRRVRVTRETSVNADHTVLGECVMPAAAMIELVGSLAGGDPVLESCAWPEPLRVPQEGVEVDVAIDGSASEGVFSVRTVDGGRLLCEGRLRASDGALARTEPIDPGASRWSDAEAHDGAQCYDHFSALGLDYGSGLRVIESVCTDGAGVLGAVRIKPGSSNAAALDGALQALVGFGARAGRLLLPFAIGRVEVGDRLTSARWVHAERTGTTERGGSTYDILLADADGLVVGRLDAVTVLPVQVTNPDSGRAVATSHAVSGSGASPVSAVPVATDATTATDATVVSADSPATAATPASGTSADSTDPGGAVHPSLRYLAFDWTEEPNRPAATPPGRVLLLGSDAGVARGLAAVLTGAGRPGAVSIAVPTEDGSVEVDGRRVAGLSEAVDAVGSDIDTVVDLMAAWPSTGAGSAEEVGRRVAAFDTVVRTAVRLLHEGPVRYFDVRSTDDSDSAAGAAVHRVLAVENPAYRGHTIVTGPELGEPGSEAWNRALADVLLGGLPDSAGAAGAVRLDGRTLHRQTLRMTAGPDTADHDTHPLRRGGICLVTGGLGGVGRQLAVHLARTREARVVVVGRRAAGVESDAVLQEIRDAGGAAVYVSADCSTENGARVAVDAATAAFGALHGVFHLAGVLRDGFAARKSADAMAAVLAPKVWGAVYLDEATRDLPLDCWVVFGSASAYVGVPGQIDYAWANAQITALTEERATAVRAGQRQGRTLVVSWPLWTDGGMTVDASAAEVLRTHLGWDPLTPQTGLAALDDMLCGSGTVHLPVYGDPAVIKAWATDHWGTAHAAAPAPAPAAMNPEPSERSGSSGQAPERAPARFVELVGGMVAEELGMRPWELRPEATFERLGLESVMAMNLSRALTDRLGQVPVTVFFEYRDVRELSDGLWRTHRAAAASLADPGGALGAGGVQEDARTEPVAPAPALTPAPPSAQEPPMASEPPSVPEPSRSYAVVARGSDELRRDTEDPVVIVGVSGRYPQADDLAEYWSVLRSGRDCVTEVPSDRWDHAALFDPAVGTVGRTYAKWGGFLREIAGFDCRFFNIAPAEARQLDPQERQFLQTAWHAVEDSGHSVAELAGSRTGVFAGVMHAHYQMYGAESRYRDSGFLPSSLGAGVANRVSYSLDLHGPSITVDTMCSSSLTAVHLACTSIRAGECDVALAGGVNVISHPYRYLQMAQGRFASTDGRCRSFGAGGDGYVPGEGVGVVVLKRRSAALRDGDHVYGVVRGGAVNHGGRTNGFTVPSVSAQADVVGRALHTAGVPAAEIDYVEAHGTGTLLGDPIEVSALGGVFAGSGPDCPIGSVKSNIGHLESAAGIAALTKVLLQFEYAELVPSLHSEPGNPEIGFHGLRVQRAHEPWAKRSGTAPLTASISSFGAGGANSHLVVAADDAPVAANGPGDGGQQIVRLSARSDRSLRESARRLADHLDPGRTAATADRTADVVAAVADVAGLGAADVDLDADPSEFGLDAFTATEIASRVAPPGQEESIARFLGVARSFREVAAQLPREDAPGAGTGPALADVAFTLASGRDEFDERLALVVDGVDELLARLREFAATGTETHRAGRTGEEDRALSELFGGPSGERFLDGILREGRLDELAKLWTQGYSVPWSGSPAGERRRVPLPGYAFDRMEMWLPGMSAEDAPADGPTEPRPADTRHVEPWTVANNPVDDAPVTAEALAGPDFGRVADTVRTAMATVLGAEPHDVELDVPHAEFGIDSVFAVDIVDRLNTTLGTDLRPTDFFQYTTVRELAEHLVGVLPRTGRAAATEEPSAPIDDPVGEAPAQRRGSALPSASPPPPEPRHADIAVVGMAVRFPGSPTTGEFWDNLVNGVDSVDIVRPERWDIGRHFDADARAPFRTYGKWGSVLADADRFDADFFGFSPREAKLMDPQQRLFLESSWHAMESAGYPADALRGRDVGVFVGASSGDYQNHLRENGVQPEGYTFTGNHAAMLPSRLSYLLDLRGPSLAVETSCSSSLMAVHLACEEIRSGRVEAAFAGGVALLFTPELHVLASKARMLSPTGRCRTFDAQADGFVPGEGVGVVLLKSLEHARRDGDRILGVVRGSGTNQDGRSNGITAPNMVAQRDLEVSVYRRFGIDPEDIGYVECHGTGTRLGDPVEIEALTAAFREFTGERNFCGLGSVKSNIGHTLTASGIAGFTKALLSLRHRRIAPTLHVTNVNDHLRLDDSPFYVAREARPFPKPRGGERLAAVSSFGFSGTNVHMVLAEPPAEAEPGAARHPDSPVLVPLSATTPDALARRVRALASLLAEGQAADLTDVAYTLGERRTHFRHRAAFIATGVDDLLDQLRRWESGTQQEPEAARDGGVLERARERYLAGETVEWAELGTGGRLVDAPLYPFEDQRHWAVDRERNTGSATVPETSSSGAPNDPTDPRSLEIVLDPKDPLVADHIVGGRPILPAAGHLSLLVDLVRREFGSPLCTIERAVWIRPVVVDEPRRVRFALTPEGDEWRWEVTSRPATSPEEEPVAHSRGRILPGEPAHAPDLDLEGLHTERDGDPHLLYHRFDTVGVRYGPAFRAITSYRVGSDIVVASLRRTPGDYRDVPVGVLDSAAQSLLALPPENDTGPHLPFAMDRVRVLRPVPETCVSVVWQDGRDQCGLTVATTTGAPCVVVDGMTSRPLREAAEVHELAPVWSAVGPVPSVPGNSPAGDVLVLDSGAHPGLTGAVLARHAGSTVRRIALDDPALADEMRRVDDTAALRRVYVIGVAEGTAAASRERLGLPVLRALRTLAGGRHASRALDVVVLTVDAHQVHIDDPVAPAGAQLFGLQRSLARERRTWSVRCVDLAAADLAGTPADVLGRALALPLDPAGREVALRAGRGWTLGLDPVGDEDGTAPVPGYRRGGTYLILGGAGGIGFVTAMHLARTAGANVVLLGRRPEDDGIRAGLDLIERAGGRGLYLSVDAADADAVRGAVADAVARFGPVHGAFHSALVLRDGLLQTMTDDAYREVCEPKAAGAENLVAALRDQPLDMFVLYSSAQSFVGNTGQANYAAASTHLDAYARELRRDRLPVRVVNWGYWGDVGIVADPKYRVLMEANGIHSVTPAEGMRALDRAVARGRFQTVVLKAAPEGLAQFSAGAATGERTRAAGGGEAFDPLAGHRGPGTAGLDDVLSAHRGMVRRGHVWALLQLVAVGIVNSDGRVLPREGWMRMGVPESAVSFVSALLRHAEGAGLVEEVRGERRLCASARSMTPQAAEADLLRHGREHGAVAAHVELLAACVRAYPDLLAGRQEPTEIMFPGSSMRLVNAVYQGDVVADGLNDLVRRALETRLASTSDRIRVVEVGAGTGGTTQALVPVLRREWDRIDYVYTDLSAGFLRHGRRMLDELDNVEFRRMDVAASPAWQGFASGAADVVVAANVLHATPDLRAAVRHTAELLRPGGWLVLLETTEVSEFATMTFGLLDGWWKFEDDLREPDSPLASVRTWTSVLRDEGFDAVAVEAPGEIRDGTIGQHVLVARRAPVGPETLTRPESVGGTAREGVTDERPDVPRASAPVESGAGALDVVGEISAVVAETLCREPGSVVGDVPFTDYGVDSIVLVELVGAVNERLGVDLKPTALFDFPTVSVLAEHVTDELGRTEPPPPSFAADAGPPAGPVGDNGMDVLERLSRGAVSLDDALRQWEDTGE
ncbi:SDR family NAD(P)-dependent oxidoreductase [Nocardiopsis sp. JB363]|uniref:SDR family NAD(P)-dependent oxidoreductase n=1 Tax=Nocardiopsis sp. JB363 TaxID=1434837 RepID=UPI00117E65CD|nr:SDR family NAD(P)-dependent oxidoreductase [Nocardiopsis sp. JB363]